MLHGSKGQWYVPITLMMSLVAVLFVDTLGTAEQWMCTQPCSAWASSPSQAHSLYVRSVTDSRGHSQRFTRRQDVTRAVWPDQGLKPCAMAQTCDFISSCKSRLRLHHHLLQSGTPGWRGLGWLRAAVQLLHDKGCVQTVLAAFGTTMHALYAADAYICET